MTQTTDTVAAAAGPITRARANLAVLETLNRLRVDPDTSPTSDELAVLRGWSGWGPMAPAFEPGRSGAWREIGERVAWLLPDEDYAQAVQATYSAFYTPPEIAEACWHIATSLGFRAGTVLEPGCGAGVFLDHTPAEVQASWIGIERDPTTAAIARLLHPNATVHAVALQEAPLACHSVDAVVGNVPFGDTPVYDPTAPKAVTASLHTYMLWRSVQALRPGGVAVVLTSRYTLDAYGENAIAARAALANDARLLGAIRLPNSALAASGTEALTDMLVLRRVRAGEPRNTDAWLESRPAIGGQHVNRYFLDRPELVLGELAPDHAPRYGRTLRVDPRPGDPPLGQALATTGRLVTDAAHRAGLGWYVDTGASAITAEYAPFPIRVDGRKEGSFHLVEGIPHEVIDGELIRVTRPGRELPKLIALRDAATALLDAEADHQTPDENLASLRDRLNELYDAYVTEHGPLNRFTLVEGRPDSETGLPLVTRRRPSLGGFRRDPDVVTVLALEDFDDDTQTARKAALLRHRVNRARQRATHAETIQEAAALCRDELGHLDAARIAQLLGISAGEADHRLAEVAFLDPATQTWTPTEEYLTGNVRTKLTQAETAAEHDPRYKANVTALRKTIPEDLLPEQILANLGAPWIPANDVEEFVRDLLGYRARVWSEPRSNTWAVQTSTRAQSSPAATSEWGTARADAYTLIGLALNGQAPAIYDTVTTEAGDRRVRNSDETMAAVDRQEAIAARFASWIWEDPARADRLAAVYNQRYNAVVPRRFDGGYLSFPGLDATFEPYAHQRDMVARVIGGSDALCPFPVGTGKTATMFMAAVKLKQLGLATKPLITVVPSTLEQIARDGKRLFPSARILMASKEDLADKRSRQLFAARCATEDWDAVVMSHPSFSSLPVHPVVEADYLDRLAANYRAALVRAGDGDRRRIKQIAKMVDRMQTRARALLDHATDDGVFFEHLGVDYLLVDELHYFKNLGVPVHTDGFAISGSKRASDLEMKLSWLRDQHPGKAVTTGFTGTPFTNTLLEAFIVQRYLQPERLTELGLDSADAWAATFVRFASAVEVTPDGGFRLNRRPVEIINLPELVNTLGEVAEFRPPEAFPLARPQARRHTEIVEPNDTITDFVAHLGRRAEAIHAGGVDPSEDNILKICSEGRKVALHPSLVGLANQGPTKVDALVEKVAEIHHATAAHRFPDDLPDVTGALQLVFCDLGTPDKAEGSRVYGRIRAGLIGAGVPGERVRFIHEASTDARRLALFDACNAGQVSVLIGSTNKLGVGVNVQKRAVALHHLDVPWRPDQVEQRDGRVWRPGNLNPSVEIYRWVVEGSFDAFMWQALERKERALRPLLSGQATTRSVEDIGDAMLDYAHIKAAATGNPLLLELNEATIEVKRLAALAAGHERNRRRLRGEAATYTAQAAAAASTAEALEAIAATAGEHADQPWRDRTGVAVGAQLAGLLGRLANEALQRGYTAEQLTWCGLTVEIVATKRFPDSALHARVSTERHRITVPLGLSWTQTGQHWRIRDAITRAVDTATEVATETRASISELQARIESTRAEADREFPHTAELEVARARRATLDADIRETAEREEQARQQRARARVAPSAPDAVTGEALDEATQRAELLRRLHGAFTRVLARSPAAAIIAAAPQPALPVDVVHNGRTYQARPQSEGSEHIYDGPRLLGTLHRDEHGWWLPALPGRDHTESRRATRGSAIGVLVRSTENEVDVATAVDRSLGEEVHETEREQVAAEVVNAEGPTTEAVGTVEEELQPRDAFVELSNVREVGARPGGDIERSATPVLPEPEPVAPRPAEPPLKPAGEQTPGRASMPGAVPESGQLGIALSLAERGFSVFPVRAGEKVPLVRNWPNQASGECDRIVAWWRRWPRANVGIACGPSRLYVIDLDTAKPRQAGDGRANLVALAAGREVPETFTVRTASGGWHLYFQQPSGHELHNTSGATVQGLAPLIDTRGEGGFVVGPGSTVNGRRYEIELDAPIAALPDWLVGELVARQTAAPAAVAPVRVVPEPLAGSRQTVYADAALRRAADTVAHAPVSARNTTLFRQSFGLGRLVGGRVLSDADARAVLLEAAQRVGLPAGEAQRSMASGIGRGIRQPRRPAALPTRGPIPVPREASMPSTPSAVASTRSSTAPVAPSFAGSPYSREQAAAFAEALRQLWRLGPEAIGLPLAYADQVRAAWSHAGRQVTDQMRPEPSQPSPLQAPRPRVVEQPLSFDPQAVDKLNAFDRAWEDVKALVDNNELSLPPLGPATSFEDIRAAIAATRDALAKAPIKLSDVAESPARRADAAARTHNGPTQPEPDEPVEAIEQQVAEVDDAYEQAHEQVGTHEAEPEWQRIREIRQAIHMLWNTLCEAAGDYLRELAADARIHGLFTTLAARAAHAIGQLSLTLAARLNPDLATSSPRADSPAPNLGDLRSAYLAARNELRSCTSTHQWQRISALLNTITTLHRQTDDPAIRAVTAHSAATLADLATSLASTLTADMGSNQHAAQCAMELAQAARSYASTSRELTVRRSGPPESATQAAALSTNRQRPITSGVAHHALERLSARAADCTQVRPQLRSAGPRPSQPTPHLQSAAPRTPSLRPPHR